MSLRYYFSVIRPKSQGRFSRLTVSQNRGKIKPDFPEKRSPGGTLKRWRLLPLPGKREFLFAFPRGEVMPMYLTLTELLALATFVLLLIEYFNQNKKK